MSTIKLKIKLILGKEGTPLTKLELLSQKVQYFLTDVGKETEMKIEPDKWIATNFKSSDLTFDVSYLEEVEPVTRTRYNTHIEEIMRADIKEGMTNQKSVKSYIGIREVLNEEEIIRFSLYTNGGDIAPQQEYDFGWDISKHIEQKILEIEGEKMKNFRGFARYYGEIRGLFVNWRMEKVPSDEKPFITIRELKSQKQIRCFYDDSLYENINLLTKKYHEIVRIAGFVKFNLDKKEIEQIDIDKIDKLPEHVENDIDQLFGAIPNLTGGLSTKEYIEKLRGLSE